MFWLMLDGMLYFYYFLFIIFGIYVKFSAREGLIV